jgi:pyridoxine 5-phosphate synthase
MTEALEQKLRLSVNIDHVATLRNARGGGGTPSPLRAARMAAAAGADGITAHLREDRRHIRDRDITRLRQEISLPLNLEMAATDEMVAIALNHLPYACCLVPEKREELTTEGGLDAVSQVAHLARRIATLVEAGIRVSLFLDPDPDQLRAAHQMGSPVVELHTGTYCDAGKYQREEELQRIVEAAAVAGELGLECHAGHGLSFDTVARVAAIPNVVELNIGHFLIGEAVFTGLESAIGEMRRRMDAARAGTSSAGTPSAAAVS